MRTFLAFTNNAWLLVLLALAASCTAPRSVINSGKVTPVGQFKVGVNFGGNIASEPIAQLDDIGEAVVDAIRQKDTVHYNQQIDVASKAMLAYALDPVGPNFDFYVRYGIVPRLDAGYKYASGVHVLDAMYQFLGPTGTPENPGQGNGWYGSVGLQYAGQSSGLLNDLFLNKLQPLLQFTAKRRDLMVPLIFSTSIGQEEEIGHFAFGVVYNHTFVNYGFAPSRLYKQYGSDYVQVPELARKNNFASYGFFMNAKIGYKYVYLLPALSIFYQNYGTYQLLEGKEYSFSGMTFIPTLGLQATFGKGRGKR